MSSNYQGRGRGGRYNSNGPGRGRGRGRGNQAGEANKTAKEGDMKFTPYMEHGEAKSQLLLTQSRIIFYRSFRRPTNRQKM